MASKAKSTIVLSLCLMFWLGLFVAGSTIPSDNVLQGLIGEGVALEKRALHLVGFIFTWTWSNILLLCCFASLVGEYGREAMSRRRIVPNPQVALVRGFFFFLAMATGQLVIVGTISLPPSLIEEAVTPQDPSVVNAAQYFRIATFCSFLNMLIGFSPRMFTNLLKRVEMLSGEDV
ncbi:MAG: hypothetical protein AB8G77_24850 [Rhodothermales bacterium]